MLECAWTDTPFPKSSAPPSSPPPPPLPPSPHTHTRTLGVSFALQAFSGVHIGIDNFNVFRGVVKLIDRGPEGSLLLLVKDGDLFAVIHSMLKHGREGTVKVSEVRGHAKQAVVDGGDVRHEDLNGNNGADAAADPGRLRQKDAAISVRRALIRARRHWYPIILDLHKFMVAISRTDENHDGHGGTAPDAMTWYQGSIIQPCASLLRVMIDHAPLPGPPGFLDSSWCSLSPTPITQEDVALSGPSVSTSSLTSPLFLATLHWPQGAADLEKFGISYLELIIMFEQNAGHRLTCEKVFRPFLGNEIRQGCQFIHSLLRSFGQLPGWLAGFVTCQVCTSPGSFTCAGDCVVMVFHQGLGRAVICRSSTLFFVGTWKGLRLSFIMAP